MDIWRLPPLLIIHLKRFETRGHRSEKLKWHVDYPIEKLDLNKYVVNDDLETNMDNYRLYAVSNHCGDMEFGHSTAMCRHLELNEWFNFDDERISKVHKRESIVSSYAYILFYSRI